jgi:hypothetical protein
LKTSVENKRWKQALKQVPQKVENKSWNKLKQVDTSGKQVENKVPQKVENISNQSIAL